MKEIHEYIAEKLQITVKEEQECIKRILYNMLGLSHSRLNKLTEKQMDTIVKITGVYIKEALEAADDPDKYLASVEKINKRLKGALLK